MGYDGALASCANRRTNVAADFYPYNTGLRLIYRDTFWQDNNVGLHSARAWMVVDAHPCRTSGRSTSRGHGHPGQGRGLQHRSTPGIWLTPSAGAPEKLWLPGRAAQPTFDDSRIWWFPWAPDAGVKIDELGVRIGRHEHGPARYGAQRQGRQRSAVLSRDT